MSDRNSRPKVSTEGGATVVELKDRKMLDELSIARIGEQINALVAKEDAPRLVVDFSNVTHMSSSGLGMLITLHKRVREKNGQLRLCNIQPVIYEVFVITRLNEIFDIYQSRDEAVQAMT